MGGGILSSLLSKADDAIYSGLKGLASKPTGVGMSKETLGQYAKMLGNDVDDVFRTQSFSPLVRKDRLKINDYSGGGTPLLQEFYERLTGCQ